MRRRTAAQQNSRGRLIHGCTALFLLVLTVSIHRFLAA